MITSGPAVTNALTGLASCYGDSVPVLLLAGQVKTADIAADRLRSHGVQEVDQLGLAKRVTKMARRVDSRNHQAVFEEAIRALSTGRLGPVYLEFPLDEQAFAVRHPIASSTTHDSAHAVPQTLPELSQFKRPVVMLGNGLRRHRHELAPRLAELQRRMIPRLYTTSSMDLEPHDLPGNLGFPGPFATIHANRVLGECDLLVTLGARLDLATTAYRPREFGSQAWRVVVDIDPDEIMKLGPMDRTNFVMADGLTVLDTIIDQGIAGEDSWMRQCMDWRASSLMEEGARLDSDELTIRNVALMVSRYAEGMIVIPASSGLAIETFTRFFRPRSGTTFFNGSSLGSMGYGLSHAIGAALSGCGAQGVWAFEGDGGLWMNVQELATLRENVPIGTVLFIFSNGGYASILRSQRANFDYEFGADRQSGLYIPPWKAVAEAVGIPYRMIESPDALLDLLSEWTPDNPTAVVELRVPQSEDRGPVLTTRIIDGVPTTPPLRDLAWPGS